MKRGTVDGPQDEFTGNVGRLHLSKLGRCRNAFHQMFGGDLFNHFREYLGIRVRGRFRPQDFRSGRRGAFRFRNGMQGGRYFPRLRVIQAERVDIEGGAGIRGGGRFPEGAGPEKKAAGRVSDQGSGSQRAYVHAGAMLKCCGREFQLFECLWSFSRERRPEAFVRETSSAA